MSQKLPNIPVTMEGDLLAEIDRVAQDKKESRSAIMRMAIRAGLPFVKSGGAGDVLTLDSELSKEVDDLAGGHKRTRNSILLEAIRHGITAVDIYAMIEQARVDGLSEVALQTMLSAHDLDVHPEKRAARKAMIERAIYWTQAADLVYHVPEARRRKEAIEKLIKIRRDTRNYTQVWGHGLTTEEIEWQIAMHEKYEGGPIPKGEIVKRDEKRKIERERDYPMRRDALGAMQSLLPMIWTESESASASAKSNTEVPATAEPKPEAPKSPKKKAGK